VLETDHTTEAIIQQLKTRIEQYNLEHDINSYDTDTTRKKKKRKLPNGDAGAGGSTGVVNATDCAELGAHVTYEVEPRDFEDEKGNVWMKLHKVRQPLSTYALR
jgi:hypothetical protein